MPRPGFNPHNERDLQRLYKAIEWSKSKLQPFRNHNLLAVRQLAGRFYGEQIANKVPINLLELAYMIYLRHLAAGTPRIHGWTPYRQLRPFALEFELAVDDLLEEICFVDTQRAAVGSALLSLGIVKVGAEAGESVGDEAYQERPFVDSISLDHWVHDMVANVWPQVQYLGNDYALPLDMVKESSEFKKSETDKMEASPGTTMQMMGDQNAHSVSIGQSMGMDDGRIIDMGRLEDIYLPYDRILVTIDANHIATKPLRVIDFTDSYQYGPFEKLSFCDLDENTVPLPPSAVWMDLHLLANNIFNKLENQAENARMVTTFQGPEGESDAKRMDDAMDGASIHISGGQKPETMLTNKIDQTNLAFLIQIKDLFSYLGGNLDGLGGLSPQAPTLGQDEMLLAGASQRLAEMQDRTHDFQRRVIRTLSYYEHGGDSTRALVKPVSGTNISVNVTWDRQRREAIGPISKYQIKIDPYSSSGTTPSAKLQGLVNIFNNFIMPMLPMWQQAGFSIDPKAVIETIARLGNLPELESWIVEGAIPIEQMPGANGAPSSDAGMPSQTKRTYERTNRPQSTRHTRDAVIMQSLLGNQSQPAEAGKLTGALG